MYMENRLFILFLFLLISCNKKGHISDKREYNEYYEGHILFLGFENLKIKQISFEEVNNMKDKIDYKSPNFDSIRNYKTIDLYFQLDSISTKLINNGCYITINEKLKYKITDVQSAEIERFGNFGSVAYDIYLKQYKLNDSIIKTNRIINICR